MLVRSTVAQPDVHNKCAGMLLKNVLNVVRGVRCVCFVSVVLCCGVSWCVLVRFGSFFESFLNTVLSRFNEDSVVTCVDIGTGSGFSIFCVVVVCLCCVVLCCVALCCVLW